MMKLPNFLLLILCLLPCWALGVAELPEKHPLDETETERFVLPNGLRVLLVSDPKLDQAAASMSIGVGSMSDPDERAGLAHFLEHMLFLGTEKFPDASEYGNYLRSNGGYSNAYTAGDHTNYHFEVYPFAFEGALDRFAQFFIAPLFSQEFTDREKNAVDSEHAKNLENDRWRFFQLWRNHYNPEHPAHHFSTGNAETLAGIQREEFIEFYNTYYSANQMALALVAPNPVSEMKEWVHAYFSEIENKGLERVRFPEDFILPKDALRLIEIEPIQDLRELTLEFAMPSFLEQFLSKSHSLISYQLGYEGEGSLLSALKEAGWATGLGSGFSLDTADYGSLSIQVSLTPAGLEHYRSVIEMIFSYIELMRQSPYPTTLFSERQTMARLEELYGDKGEGANRAVALANNLRVHDIEIAERVNYLWTEPDPEHYFALLDHIRPQTMMVSLTAKGLEVDQQEPIYGTPYRYTETPGSFFEGLQTPALQKGLRLPSPNPFVPESVKLLAERPVKLLDEPGLELYYSQDQTFQRPKVAIQFKIRHPEAFPTLEHAVLKDFYADVVRESLNELAYPARMAGLGYSIASGAEGLYLTLSGYSESAMSLLNEILDAMLKVEVPVERFEAIQDLTVRSLENFPKGDAWVIARDAKRELTTEVYFTPSQRLTVARDIELEDVQAFAKVLFAQAHVESLIHGNVTAEEAVSAARLIQARLDYAPLERSELFDNGALVLDSGIIAERSLKLEVSNSAYWSEYGLGSDEPEVRAAALILNNFIAEPYYSEMRTQQQLGYIVSAFAGREEQQYFLYFVIQSGQYAADELQQRSEAFISTLPAQFASLPSDAFERLREAAIALVEQKPKSIAEKAGGFFEKAYELDLDFDRTERSVRALREVTHAQVLERLTRALSPEHSTRRMVLAFGREHEGNQSVNDSFSASSWKAEQRFE
ncbi:MAG: insulinase family protein [Puniceicoccaceae bacterium]